ncbi:hypothetical protein Tco_0532120 [Tanacetum coccineum]
MLQPAEERGSTVSMRGDPVGVQASTTTTTNAGWSPSHHNNIMDLDNFKWKDEITFGNASSFPRPSTPPISSSGPSRAALILGNTECSNCKLLIMKIKILEARLAMKRHPDDHTCQSAAIFHELLNEMENLRVE